MKIQELTRIDELNVLSDIYFLHRCRAMNLQEFTLL